MNENKDFEIFLSLWKENVEHFLIYSNFEGYNHYKQVSQNLLSTISYVFLLSKDAFTPNLAEFVLCSSKIDQHQD